MGTQRDNCAGQKHSGRNGLFLAASARQAREAFFVSDRHGRVRVWSGGAARLLGWTADEVLNRSAVEVLDPWLSGPHGADEFEELTRSILAGHRIHSSASLRCKGESRLPVVVRLEPLLDAEGAIVGTLAIVCDMAREHGMEQRLRVSEERYRSVLSSVATGVIVMAPDRTPVSVNPAADRILDVSADLLTGRLSAAPSWAMLRASGEPLPLDELPSEITARTGDPCQDVIMGVSRPDGSVSWLFVNTRALSIGMENNRHAVVITFIDITERKQHEQRLNEMTARAEAASHAKSVFLTNMSHELRTPMNGIVGMTELALGTELTSPQRQYMESVLASATSLLCSIDSILELSRVESGNLQLERAPFDPLVMVNDCLLPVRTKARSKSVDVRLEISPDVPQQVLGDRLRVGQVLTNLLDNAVKFTERGAVTLRVQTQSAGLRFTVSDTGIGISPEMQEQVFDAFAQVDASRSRRYGGAGLGLSLSRSLAVLMGGAITLASGLGQGSTFCFDVPLSPVVQQPRVALSPWPGAPAVLHGLSVLIVDDNATNRKIVRQVLDRIGVSSFEAVHGVEAVRLTLERHPDIVLMDVQMPEMDGYEATRRIREAEEGTDRHTLVLAMTADALVGTRERCLAAGMDDYLPKPFRQEALAALLARTVAGKQVMPSTDDAHTGLMLFDRQALSERLGADDAFQAEIIEMFILSVRERLPRLRIALDALEWKTAIAEAHALRGASLNVSACALAARLDALEQAAKSGDGSAVLQLVGPMVTCADATIRLMSSPVSP